MKKGLTLVELLVTIVILGILVAIALPVVGSLIENSKKDAIIGTMKSMVDAVNNGMSTQDYEVPTQGTPTYITLDQLEEDGFLKPYRDPFLKNQSLLVRSLATAPTSDTDNVTMIVVKTVSGSKQLKYYVKYVTTKASGEEAYQTKGTNGLIEASTIKKDDLELTP
ncbi:MAG: type II secretion system protein [Bacilli bacterium]